jgi:aspartate aminotransferase
MSRENRQGISPDLVCRISIRGNPVGASDHRFDAAFPHHLSGHRIANQGCRNLCLQKFPRREPCALEQRSCLVDKHMHRDPLLFCREENTERRSEFRSGESSRIAMRQGRTEFLPDQADSVDSNRAAHRPVFLVDRAGFFEEPPPKLFNGTKFIQSGNRLCHSPQRPKQIDGCRAACRQISGGFCHPLSREERFVNDSPQGDNQSIGCGDSNGRCPANLQGADRFPDRLHVMAIHGGDGLWQQRLIEQHEVPVLITRPADREDLLHGIPIRSISRQPKFPGEATKSPDGTRFPARVNGRRRRSQSRNSVDFTKPGWLLKLFSPQRSPFIRPFEFAMPELSRRAHLMPASPIRKLAPYADQAKSRGTRVYHLNIGQPDIPTPEVFWHAIRDANLKVLEYSPSQGIPLLRKKIADYYARIGHPVPADSIIVTSGASEAIGLAFAAILNPGDEVIVPEPYYANYLSFALGRDGHVVPVTSNIDDGFQLPSPDAFEARITPRTKAILICNPGNPTGAVYCRESLERLGDIVKRHDLFLIADEVYREFVYGGARHHSVLGLKGMEQNAIVVDSISKRFSACGARIGCILSQNEEFMDPVMRMAQARLSPPTLGQIGAAAMYDLPSSYYESVNAEYAARRDVLIAGLNRLDGVYCPDVNGAFYAMARLPVDSSEVFCQWILEDFSHDGATVMMAPGEGFYATPGLGRDEVRIAYVLNREDLKRAIEIIGMALSRYPGATVAGTAIGEKR